MSIGTNGVRFAEWLNHETTLYCRRVIRVENKDIKEKREE
jgi:hypothetical protein